MSAIADMHWGPIVPYTAASGIWVPAFAGTTSHSLAAISPSALKRAKGALDFRAWREWNESRKEESREEGCKESRRQEAGEEGSPRQAQEGDGKAGSQIRNQVGSKAGTQETGREDDLAQQQRRAHYLEFQAAQPPPARRLRRHGRRHVDSDRAGRPPHPLAGA